MTQVIQLYIETPLLRQARNITESIINLAKVDGLTPEKFQSHLRAIDLLAREAHDLIVDAEFEQEDDREKAGGHTERGHTPT
jgi:hypothetical protein